MLRGLAVGVLSAAAVCAVLAAPAGARGGNHGCEQGSRTFFSDHFFASGDNIVAGHEDQTPALSREPAARGFSTDQEERIGTVNSGDEGEGPSRFVCGAQSDGFWTLFRSDLGPGDDSLRMDARGPFDSEFDFDPLPRYIDTNVTGGAGPDVLRGHAGFDDLSGDGGNDKVIGKGGLDLLSTGTGRDVVKAVDGRIDHVACGPDRDQAVVDKRDDVRGCERVTVR